MTREPRLLFNWPPRHNLHVALSLMVIASLAIHAAGFVLFEIVYPRPAPPDGESAEVNFLLPGSRMAQRMAPLLAGSDPALFSPGVAESSLPRVSFGGYAPGFDDSSPGLKAFPADPAHPAASAAPNDTGPVPDRAAAPPPASTQVGVKTVVIPSGELAGRSLIEPAERSFQAAADQNPESVDFLVGVRSDGAIPYVFLQHGSRNASLDRQALAYIGACRFTALPSGKDIAWGRLTFHWGSDLKRLKSPDAQ